MKHQTRQRGKLRTKGDTEHKNDEEEMEIEKVQRQEVSMSTLEEVLSEKKLF